MSSRTAAARLGGFRPPKKSDRGDLIAAVTGVPQDHPDGALVHLAIAEVSPNPDNPREELEGIEGLAESIRSFGVLQPLVVVRKEAFAQQRPDIADALATDATHVVLDGHRRLAAAMEASCDTIPVIISADASAAAKDVLGITFATQFHAQRLSPLAQSAIIKSLIDLLGGQDPVAKLLGISQGRISQILSYTRLSDELQAGLEAGTYSAEDVKSLSRRDPEEQKQVAEERRQKRQAKKSARPAAAEPANAQVPAQKAPAAAAPLPEQGVGLPEPVATAAASAPDEAGAGEANGPVLIDIRKAIHMPWGDGSKVAALAIEEMSREQIAILVADLRRHLGE
ncbi:ParB/RepB/Spo0J family partition protein [Streptomyces lavendulae]|uniref:ParB/RepB/Spo0J family partition protein n=1 Tax=Streptomyces lavendulae TaxID=1914 RepID=UPI0036BC3F88